MRPGPSELETRPAEELVSYAFETFGPRAAIGTALQLSGSVLIDMAARWRDRTGRPGSEIRIFVADTLRLFPETYSLMEEIERRYGISIERATPDPAKLSKMLRDHGELLFFETKAKQEFCCHLRKVEPVDRVMGELDCWIAGVRRDQSPVRAGQAKAEEVDFQGRKILKLCPLADWTQERVRAYIAEHRVPFHPLVDKGFPSIGCRICTTPVLPGEAKRAGRWRWWNTRPGDDAKECGLHLSRSEK